MSRSVKYWPHNVEFLKALQVVQGLGLGCFASRISKETFCASLLGLHGPGRVDFELISCLASILVLHLPGVIGMGFLALWNGVGDPRVFYVFM